MSAWPWLAVAGAGALHGLNPASGWIFAVLHGWRAPRASQALRALVPVAAGHAASVALVAVLAMLGAAPGRGVFAAAAGGLALVVAALRFGWCLPERLLAPAGRAGLGLWSFAVATAHGAGMMLVPALIPVCVAGSPAREITASGSLALGFAAVALHLAAMLAAAGAVALAIARGLPRAFPLLRRR